MSNPQKNLYSLRFRLSVYFLFFGLIPALALGAYSYMNSAFALRQRIFAEMETSTQQYAGNIAMRLDKLSYYVDYIFLNGDINKMVIELNNGNPISEFAKKIQLFGNLFYREKDLRTCIIFAKDRENYLAYRNRFVLEPALVFDRPWRIETLESNGRIEWVGIGTEADSTGTEVKVFTVARTIQDLTRFNPTTPIGYIYISVSLDFLSGGVAEESEDSFYLLDETNAVVMSENDRYDLQTGTVMDFPESSRGAENRAISWEGRSVMVSSRDIPGYKWKVVRIVPYGLVTDQIKGIAIVTLAIGMACLFGLFLLSILLSRRVAAPLVTLDQRMRSLENGDFDVSVKVTSQDEIGHIQHGFNLMAANLKVLFARVVEVEKEKRTEEIKALQYQVNPHFLYNTLNSIRLMARMIQAQAIEEMTGALIRLLKNAIGKSGPLVPVEEEIQNIRDFIYIQQIRYGESIDVEYDIPEDCRSLLLPNFILQPVVENAIFHGIIPQHRKGFIRISVFRSSSILSIEIIDNGKGIPQNELDNILRRKQVEDGFVRVGLANVNQRIVLGFGMEYGVSIQSKEGQGTEVCLTLPILKHQEEQI